VVSRIRSAARRMAMKVVSESSINLQLAAVVADLEIELTQPQQLATARARAGRL
jgi:hypothetical protein